MAIVDKMKKYFAESDKDYNYLKFNEYAKIYAYQLWWEQFSNDNVILKGAFNFFENYDYIRFRPMDKNFTLTADIDFAITNMSLDSLAQIISKSIDDFNESNDVYKIVRSDDFVTELKIKTGEYGGIRINCESQFKDNPNYHWPFQIDVAFEEIPSDASIVTDDKGRKIYSISKSLAEKYVSMIIWGKPNRRDKDFIDLYSLYDSIQDKSAYIELIRKYFKVKNVSQLLIDEWKANWREWVGDIVARYKLSVKIFDVIEDIHARLFNN